MTQEQTKNKYRQFLLGLQKLGVFPRGITKKSKVSYILLPIAKRNGYLFTLDKGKSYTWSGVKLTDKLFNTIIQDYEVTNKQKLSAPKQTEIKFAPQSTIDIQYHIDKVKAAGYIVSKKIITYQEV
jgi:hypothetical protein